ncbi:hypothetical protein [Gorillibacterium sp. CAU 1737]|uniref:hypothetical protein n=1 Tax=Gorillibacterium sp. CAU 1737 TaxID=3140362 RepID=UPI003260061D
MIAQRTVVPREAYYRMEPAGPVISRRIEDLTPEEQARINGYKPPYRKKPISLVTTAPSKWDRNDRRKNGR